MLRNVDIQHWRRGCTKTRHGLHSNVYVVHDHIHTLRVQRPTAVTYTFTPRHCQCKRGEICDIRWFRHRRTYTHKIEVMGAKHCLCSRKRYLVSDDAERTTHPVGVCFARSWQKLHHPRQSVHFQVLTINKDSFMIEWWWRDVFSGNKLWDIFVHFYVSPLQSTSLPRKKCKLSWNYTLLLRQQEVQSTSVWK